MLVSALDGEQFRKLPDAELPVAFPRIDPLAGGPRVVLNSETTWSLGHLGAVPSSLSSPCCTNRQSHGVRRLSAR